MSALVILVTGIWNRPAEINLDQTTFTQTSENIWSLESNGSAMDSLQNGQRVFFVYEGNLNIETGNKLQKVYGTVLQTNGVNSISWNPIESNTKPVSNDNGLYLDYVGATLTAAAFDKVLPGLGKWLELNMFANLGTGFCIIANLPIIWLFGYQAMSSYKEYIRKLKAGEFTRS